jgi:hypothetical protein
MGYRLSKWSKETVLEAICSRRASGCSLSLTCTRQTDSPLFQAALRHFGGWRQAVEAAGFDYETVLRAGRKRRSRSISKWTRHSVLREVRRLWDLGEDIRLSAVGARYPGLPAPAAREFGSWAALLEAAGIPLAAAEAAALVGRGWKSSWLESLRSQASLGDEGGKEASRRYRRAFAIDDTIGDAQWLERLAAGVGRRP